MLITTKWWRRSVAIALSVVTFAAWPPVGAGAPARRSAAPPKVTPEIEQIVGSATSTRGRAKAITVIRADGGRRGTRQVGGSSSRHRRS